MKAPREEDNPLELLDINRTGIMVNPTMAAALITGTEESIPSSKGNSSEIASERAEYLQAAALIGSNPAIMDGDLNEESGTEGENSNFNSPVLLDKLGERLAFERQGTRLYEAFIQKIEAIPMSDPNAPTEQDLRHILAEERKHFELLQKAIVKLGGDATVQTPSADVAGVLSNGVLQIMSDPRTTLTQSLQAVLTAELCDNDGWQMLQDLADHAGYSDLAENCGKALEEEQEHLEHVRGWLSTMVLTQLSGDDNLDTEPASGSDDAESDKEKSGSSKNRRSGRKKPTGRKKRKK